MILLPGLYTNNTIGAPFIEIDSVGSTNNYAMELIREGKAAHGTAVFAKEQFQGRGQRGKTWNTSKGENIILSVILNTGAARLTHPFILSMLSGLAAYDFFFIYAGAECSVKWPNDLYWRDRKAGGILIDTMMKGKEWQWVVIGIGININQTDFKNVAGHAVSLKQITGKTFDPVQSAKELCNQLQHRYEQFMNGGEAVLFADYNAVLYKKDKEATLKNNNRVFSTIIKGVTPYGQLITGHETAQLFNVGEIEWVISPVN